MSRSRGIRLFIVIKGKKYNLPISLSGEDKGWSYMEAPETGLFVSTGSSGIIITKTELGRALRQIRKEES